MNYQVMPDLSDADFQALKSDIEQRGVLVPVEYDDAENILDGHHRVKACNELGIETWPRLVRKGLSEDDKRVHARQLNIARRHLNQSQKRDLISDQLKDTPSISDRAIAAMLGAVDHKTVTVVRKKLVAGGEIPHHENTTGIDGIIQPRSKPIRTAFIDDTTEGKKEALNTAKQIRSETAVERREERLDNIAEISRGNVGIDISKAYPIIYADPPWRYENPPIGGSNRSIENHYPTMTLDEICALPVADLATDDALLYMWATAPKLAECMQVIDAWGFDYRTNLVWDKEVIGMGYHARNQHEILLVSKRGNIPPPQAGKQPSSIHREKRSGHSVKPTFYYEMIEAAYPQLPKIELFCRSPRKGWVVWGNQSEGVNAA